MSWVEAAPREGLRRTQAWDGRGPGAEQGGAGKTCVRLSLRAATWYIKVGALSASAIGCLVGKFAAVRSCVPPQRLIEADVELKEGSL